MLIFTISILIAPYYSNKNLWGEGAKPTNQYQLKSKKNKNY